MKKAFTLLSMIILLYSCNTQHTVEKELPIENFVSEFIREYPNYDLNDITLQEANDAFQMAILDTLNKDNLLYGVPLKLNKMNKFNGKSMVHLGSWIEPYDWDYKYPVDKLYVDVIGEVDDSLVSILRDGAYYRIYGRFIRRLNGIDEIQRSFGGRVSAYTNFIGLKKEFYDNCVHLGVLYYQLDSLISFTGRDVEYIKK